MTTQDNNLDREGGEIEREAAKRAAMTAVWGDYTTGRIGSKEFFDAAFDAGEKFAAQPQAGAAVASIEYTPGSWFEARTLDEMQAFYMSRLPAIREAAKEHGYAIGLHGTARRDFDLMAMQWRESASDKDTLAHAIAVAACGITRDGAYQWEQKPNGRFAVSLPICWTDHSNPDFDKPSMGHIDLSVIDAGAIGMHAAANFIEKRAQDYINENAETEPDTGAVVWRYGNAGLEYHSTLVELADDLRNTTPPASQAVPGDEVRDGERLDFLEELVARNDDAMPNVRAFGKTFMGETLRDAIDAALHTTKTEGKEQQ